MNQRSRLTEPLLPEGSGWVEVECVVCSYLFDVPAEVDEDEFVCDSCADEEEGVQ